MPDLELTHSDVGSPWEEPIVWRTAGKGALRSFAKMNATHIVREVVVSNKSFERFPLFHQMPLTRAQVEDTLEIADEQYRELEDRGIKVTMPEWHIFEDPRSQKMRALGRVGIIVGFEYGSGLGTPTVQELHPPIEATDLVIAAIEDYHLTVPYRKRLTDSCNLEQYMFGHLKGQNKADSAYLVDIEPRIG
jgi:hypothetical protein